MKWLEWLGVGLAMIGFLCLSFGFGLPGFSFGIASCCFLLVFFWENNIMSMFSLQTFFLAANIIGLLRTNGAF